MPRLTNHDVCSSKHGNNYESKAAFQNNRSRKEIQHELIIDALLDNPDGMTEEQLSLHLGMLRHSASARIAELKQLGAICRKPLQNPPDNAPTWERRKTTSGSYAAVLVINPEALEAL
jgi:hypothetical protein